MSKLFNTKRNNNSLVEEIVTLGLAINSETKFCVFFSFSGHVNQFSLTVAKSKEEYDQKISSIFELYLTPYTEEGDEDFVKDTLEITKTLRNGRNKLKAFLEENRIKEPFLNLGGEEENSEEIPF